MTDAEFIKKTTEAFRIQREARDRAIAQVVIIVDAVLKVKAEGRS